MTFQRREWDSNPRWLSPRRFSKPLPSAARSSLRAEGFYHNLLHPFLYGSKYLFAIWFRINERVFSINSKGDDHYALGRSWQSDLFSYLAIEKAESVCLLPLSCIERHAHHLPLGTDMFIGRDLCNRAAALEPAIVFPISFSLRSSRRAIIPAVSAWTLS